VDEQRARDLLEAERVRLQGILDAGQEDTFGDAEQERSSDVIQPWTEPADAPQELYEEEQQESFRRHAEAELREVEHALQKLEDGTYGVDERSGEPIPDERLEAVPATRYALENQRLAEAEADLPNSRTEGDATSTTGGGRMAT
jgi:RNA polymerase-binding transcription factor DksA